jgi:hypothetical protein
MAEITKSLKETAGKITGGFGRGLSKLSSVFKSKKIEPDMSDMSGNMSNTQYLGSIYQLMVDSDEERRLEYEREQNLKEESDSEEQRQHQEIIKALTLRRAPKPKRVIRREKKAAEKAEAGKPTKKVETPKKEKVPKTEAPKAEAPKTTAPKTEAPKKEAPKTEAPKKEAPKTAEPVKQTPKQPAPKPAEPVKPSEPVKSSTATPKPSIPAKPSVTETAVKITTGGAGIAGMSAAAAASIKLETGSDASQAIKKVGQIVDNDPKAGVKSYGVFGLNSGGKNVNESSIGSFVKENRQFAFKSTIASKQFDNEWTNIANTRPKELLDAQLAWYDRHVAKPALKDLSGFPIAIVSDPRVILYMTDRRNQYGGQGLKSALQKVKSVSTAEEFIDKMTEIDLNNIEKDFKTYLQNNPKNKLGLVSRIEKRKKLALSLSKMQEVTKTEEKSKQVISNASSGTHVDQYSRQNKDMKAQDKPAPVNVQQNTTNVSNTSESSTPSKVDDRPAHKRK